MAGIIQRISIDDSQFVKGTGQLIRAAESMLPLMTIAGGVFENSTRDRFDRSRGPGGIPWAPTWKQRVGAVGGAGPVKNSRTLVNEGNLRGSLRSNVGADFVETGVDARSVSSKYAATHQFGATITPKAGGAADFIGPSRGGRKAPKGGGPVRDFAQQKRALMFTGPDGRFYMVQSVTIPARQFLGIDQDDVRDLRDVFIDYFEGATNGA